MQGKYLNDYTLMVLDGAERLIIKGCKVIVSSTIKKKQGSTI